MDTYICMYVHIYVCVLYTVSGYKEGFLYTDVYSAHRTPPTRIYV